MTGKIAVTRDSAGGLWLSARVVNPRFFGTSFIKKSYYHRGTNQGAALAEFLWALNYERLELDTRPEI